MQAPQNEGFKVIVGLGKSGLACAKYFSEHHIPFAITDTRKHPPCLEQFQRDFPSIKIKLGGLNKRLLAKADELIVSPGLSLKQPALASRLARGVPAIGDIELFARLAKAPICAITGSNAKSTVTALVNKMAQVAGTDVRMGGNIGIPVLELIHETEPEMYVLELSSYQLETTASLHAAAATILNISEDHMDHYDHSLEKYIAAKQHIYSDAEFAIFNRDDQHTHIQHLVRQQLLSFGLSAPKWNEFGIMQKSSGTYLAFGDEMLMSVNELKLKGKHNWANALAALALAYAMKLPMPAMLTALRDFEGLPHRCQWVLEKDSVGWYNDSKGTNVGATVAALEGLGSASNGKIVLLAGGQAKDADFSDLIQPLKQYVSQLILYGEDAKKIEAAIGDSVPTKIVKDLEDAVYTAKNAANPGDEVLLSPACASFDMFKNFEHRGDVFMQLVKEQLA